MAKQPPVAALAKRKLQQLRKETRRVSLDQVRHLRHALAEATASHIASDGSPPEFVCASGNGVQDPRSGMMDLQTSIYRAPAPKRTRPDSLEPAGVTTRRQVAEALNRAQSSSSPAENLVLMKVPLPTAFPVDSPVLVTDPPLSAVTIRLPHARGLRGRRRKHRHL
jgi:hypothetical protein